MSVFKKLSIVLHGVHWQVHVYVHFENLNLRAAVAANRSITTSMPGVPDRWICSIIRHSRRFSSIEALNACSLMSNVNVVNRICCFFLIIFLGADWGLLWPPWPPPGWPDYAPVIQPSVDCGWQAARRWRSIQMKVIDDLCASLSSFTFLSYSTAAASVVQNSSR